MALDEHAPIDVFELADHIGVTTITPGDIVGMLDEDLKQLLVEDPSGWSAITLVFSSHPIIIYNPEHSAGRTASNMAHELAHILLGHEGSRLVASIDVDLVMRGFDAKQEDEANWLGWTILVPRVALVRARSNGMTPSRIAREFGVSLKLVEFRLARTGVDRQLHRRTRR